MNWKTAAAALVIGVTTLAAVAPADAQWRGRRGGYDRGYNNGGAILGGLAAGAILGGALAASQNRGYYDEGPVYREGYYGGGDRDQYCFSRYRSYDPQSGTYLGFDGRRHAC